MMKMDVGKVKYWIGCSGFHYVEWKDQFYPVGLPKTKWFDYYSTIFNTVELNVTFYRTMKSAFFENLYARSPENFKFSVKASRIITHYKKFNEVKTILTEFYNTITNGLKEKLGCVLFQLPPGYLYTDENLTKIIDALDTSMENVVEFRHPSWWNPVVHDALQKKGIGFCTVSYPGIPNNLIINEQVTYIRLHGVPVLYHSTYSKKTLLELSQELRTGKSKKVYIYFDNTASMAAIKNAIQIKKILGVH